MMIYHPLVFDFLNILLFEEDAVVIGMEAAVVAEASASMIAWTADVETVVP